MGDILAVGRRAWSLALLERGGDEIEVGVDGAISKRCDEDEGSKLGGQLQQQARLGPVVAMVTQPRRRGRRVEAGAGGVGGVGDGIRMKDVRLEILLHSAMMYFLMENEVGDDENGGRGR